jgi:hypothetical protein
MLCEHGCGKEAKFYSKNTKKWRCSKHANNCPEKSKKTGLSIKNAFKKIDPITGKTSNELRLEKIRLTRTTKIDAQTGLPLDVARAYKAHDTKKNTLTPNGRTIAENTANKISKTKRNDSLSSDAAKRGGQTKKNTMNAETGLTIHETSIRRRLETMNKIDRNGLTKFETALRKGMFRGYKMCKYKNTSLYYQGSLELSFLHKQYDIFNSEIENHVRRGKGFWYFDVTRQQDRMCFPDFIIDDINIFEIKSNWTWNNNKPGSDIEKRNTCKLNSLKNLGYNVFLVLENKEIKW